MAELQKIRDLAQQHNITPRTLRYYEEIGLLTSERNDDSAYRQYSAAAVSRLEQILLLRRMELPIRDIQAIFKSNDLTVAVDAFTRKLNTLDSEIATLTHLRETIESFLAVLRQHGIHQAGGLLRLQDLTTSPAHEPSHRQALQEERNMQTELTHVRIIELKPMKVAYYRAVSTTPEDDAWAVLKKWIEENGIHQLPATRIFGFNTSVPTPSAPEYGYEMWVTVPDNTAPSGPIQIKEFTGGLYAAISSYIPEIPQRWQQLINWVKGSDKWACAPGLCLEETTTPYGTPGEEWQLDLLEPIVRK